MLLVSLLADPILSQPFSWGRIQSLGLAIGLGIVGIGFFHSHRGFLFRLSANLCLSLLSAIVLLSAGELFFRAIGHDFSGELSAWRRVPPYYRTPTTPTGTVFFRRSGPERWSGQVLRTFLKQNNVLPNPYAREPAITVTYDRNGFRNPDDMADWKIAVAGDSFTELGYLPYEQLFTSVLARILKVPVLNLGASYTGPLTQLHYLREYGVAAGTRHVLIVFFEGNDLEDLDKEYDDLIRWRETGQRLFREFKKQPSLVRALNGLARGKRRQEPEPDESKVSAYFKSFEGTIPVTLAYTPPGRSQLSEETMRQLSYFFGHYADLGKERDVTVWVAYMPCKRRVLHGQVEFSANASEKCRNWHPTDLPEVISRLCDQYAIRFIDLTPALIRETAATRALLFNSVFDTHLNAHGSMIVGQELARRISGQDP